jgi:putative PIN family toxin of toxin-antitoxin system
MIRAVVDTNVVVSGLIKPDGPCGRILRALRERDFVIVVSAELLKELSAVLQYPKIQTKYGIDRTVREALFALIALRGDLVTAAEPVSVCRDSDDDRILEAALAGQADFIVSGDADLSGLKRFRGVRIVSPKGFLKSIARSRSSRP